MGKLLSLDLSSKVGYAVAEIDLETKDFKLVESGGVPKVDCGKEPYPTNYYNWALTCSNQTIELIKKVKPDKVVIEETTPGRNALSQKFLDWVHLLIIKYLVIDNKYDLQYLRTGEWRKLIDLHQTKEDKLQNKEINKIRKATGDKVVKADGKRIGKITKKHLSVRFANEKFDLSLKLKDNDQADAICIAFAEFIRLIK